MFRQTCRAALLGLAALANFTLATAQEPKATGGEKQITNSIGMKLTLIPAGEFKMGSGESAEATAVFFNKYYGMDYLAADQFKDEYPHHWVQITKPFYLGTYHVTRGQFRQFVKDSGYKTDAEKDDDPGALGWDPEKTFDFKKDYSWRNAGFEQTDEHPAVNVSWNDAVDFCRWLSNKEGKIYRLPTEAEWEYACRAGTKTRYSSGDDPETLVKVANVADATAKAKFPDRKYRAIKASDGYVFTAPVGQFKPNAFGLYDMHGNANQWCADWYGERYYGQSLVGDPTGPEVGTSRVQRGGNWCFDAASCLSSCRKRLQPQYRDHFTGFRVARTQ